MTLKGCHAGAIGCLYVRTWRYRVTTWLPKGTKAWLKHRPLPALSLPGLPQAAHLCDEMVVGTHSMLILSFFSRHFLSKDVEKLPVDVAWEGICPDGLRKAGKGSLTWILVLPEGFSPSWEFTSPSELTPLSFANLSSVFLWLHDTPATPTLAKGKNMLSTKKKWKER